MTPKERAEQIFGSMKGFRVKHSHSKKCAKVAVQLILSTVESVSPTHEYYEQVFEELNKIKTP